MEKKEEKNTWTSVDNFEEVISDRTSKCHRLVKELFDKIKEEEEKEELDSTEGIIDTIKSSVEEFIRNLLELTRNWISRYSRSWKSCSKNSF